MTGSKEWQDYFYEGTTILKNVPGIMDKEQLARYEAEVSINGMTEYLRNGEAGLDTEAYKKIHYTIFKDVYPFAGQFRNVNMGKGDTDFCPHEVIEDELAKRLFEIECNPESYSDPQWLAYNYSELNMVHPFREGNGRCCRCFWTKVLSQENLYIDFASWSKLENAAACDAAYKLNYKPLEELIKKSLYEIKPERGYER